MWTVKARCDGMCRLAFSTKLMLNLAFVLDGRLLYRTKNKKQKTKTLLGYPQRVLVIHFVMNYNECTLNGWVGLQTRSISLNSEVLARATRFLECIVGALESVLVFSTTYKPRAMSLQVLYFLLFSFLFSFSSLFFLLLSACVCVFCF